MKGKAKKATVNILTGMGSQLVLIIMGIIIPRLVLTHFGSDVNGVLSTISQVFVYVGLLEAGIGQATRNALFQPLTENDKNSLLRVMTTSKKYFQKVTSIYILIVIAIAIFLPFVLNTGMEKKIVFFIVILEGFSNALPFYFTETEKQLINVEGKYYVISNINLIIRMMMYGIKIVLIILGMDIVLIQFGYFIVSLFQVFLYKCYFKRCYGWVTYKSEVDESLLQDRNGYMASEFAWTVFSSTDMIVLSMFASTSLASVYSVYNMVFSYLCAFMEAVYGGLTFLLGQSFHENKQKYIKIHDTMELAITTIICAAMSICCFLIIPFVRLYTRGVTDVEYIIPSIPILFGLIQILSWARKVCGNLTALAGYAKQVGKISLIEAFLNIILSIVLVNFMGIYGVLLATVVTLLFKTIYLYIKANRNILKRSLLPSMKNLVVNVSCFLICIFISNKVDLKIDTYSKFFMCALLISIIIIIVFGVINIITNYRLIHEQLRKLCDRRRS